jgi:calcineurin-like phosphoesterase family protein
MAENVFFTSDEHLGHNNVIKFCNRPFANIEEMTEALVERHNSVVKKGDLVYHIGDMFWRTYGIDQALEYMDRLNGNHYYVWGNHDELIHHNKELANKFIWLKDIAKVRPSGCPKIILCHYAMRVFEGSHRGDWHLYGHSHNALPQAIAGQTKDESTLSFDIGVDTHNFYPWSIEEVAEKMKTLKPTSYNYSCGDCGRIYKASYQDDTTRCANCGAKMMIV